MPFVVSRIVGNNQYKYLWIHITVDIVNTFTSMDANKQ